MYVGWGGETYLEKKRYVCMYAWSKRTYLKSRGMYVCRRHRRVVHSHHVCMSGTGMYVCMYVGMYVCMYVCPGKHTYRVNYRYVWYVCMSGYMCNTDVYVAKECRWYLCMSKVCISGDTYIHTYLLFPETYIHTYHFPGLYVSYIPRLRRLVSI